MSEEVKITQGQRKALQRIRELFENVSFIQLCNEAKSLPPGKKRNKAITKIAEEFFLDYEMGTPFLDFLSGREVYDLKSTEPENPYLDFCQITDEPDEYLNPNFKYEFDLPPSRRPRQKHRINIYPIHIGISPLATKRDVLDFVSKRWDLIRNFLDQYSENNKRISKKRKPERDRFIWENRSTAASELAKLVNEKFPDENLTYSDINSIIYYLKRRKSQL